MKKTILTIVAAVTVASAAARSADQSMVDEQSDSIAVSHRIITMDGDRVRVGAPDSTYRRLAEFVIDQFRSFQDPEAPYFMLMSKDSQLAMGIGGAVRMRGYYDWGHVIPVSGFAPYLIPMQADPASPRKFGTTPAGTCLFFRVIGRNKALGHYQLYVEANFNGYESRDLHLKKAYAVINDFTIGYASSTFSDPAATPPTVDAQGPTNKLANTAVLVRWMHTWRDSWVLALSAETPSTAIDADDTTTRKVSDWMPDAAAFVQYQWGRSSHLRLSGVVRHLAYRDVAAARNCNRTGWGLMLSGTGHPTRNITSYASVNYGHGYAGLGGDLIIGRYDMVADPMRPGRMYAPASFGYCLGLQYNFRPNLFVSANFSQTRYLPAHAVAPVEYKYGMMAAANVFWNLTPRIQVGAEYDWGLRRNFSGEHAMAQRLGAMCQFSF